MNYYKRSFFVIFIITIVFLLSWHLSVLYSDYNKVFPDQLFNKQTKVTGVIASLINKDKARTGFLFSTKYGLIKLNIYPNKNIKYWRLKPGSKWSF